MANLEAFGFHSTMKSSRTSPSQTPALSSKREICPQIVKVQIVKDPSWHRKVISLSPSEVQQ